MKGQSTDQKPNKKLWLIRKAKTKLDLKFQSWPIEKVILKVNWKSENFDWKSNLNSLYKIKEQFINLKGR